jgi:hypothetical protein
LHEQRWGLCMSVDRDDDDVGDDDDADDDDGEDDDEMI